MQRQSHHVSSDECFNAQRAIVLHLLDHDRSEHWRRAELRRRFTYIPPAAFDGALHRLIGEGVAVLRGEELFPSRAAGHLDMLGLIAA
jgi:hypothetical protein